VAEADKLADYRAKRDAGSTPEPSGAPGADGDGAGNRFVVQEHHATRLHWDLRLERDGALASWAVPNGIPDDPKRNRKAIRTEDHPLEYLAFEGDIPKGNYGAGSMRIWDTGTYEAEKWRDDEVIATFHGERLNGRYALVRTGRDEASAKEWLMHRMDPPVDAEAEPMPQELVPMLAKPGRLPAVREQDRWAFEIKWDGVRALVHSEPGRIRLESRNGRDITASYPELRPLNRALSHHRAILDGEIVAFDADGKPSFSRLQQRMHLTGESQVRRRAQETPVVLVLFDLLWLDGHSLMHLPYDERRARLLELELTGPSWQTPAAHHGDGAALLAATAAQGLEGLVAKRRDAPYEPGRRSGAWIKVKNIQRQEVVIAGWLPGEGRRESRIGALVVGVHEPADPAVPGRTGPLRYAGRVGTGFTDATLEDLQRRLAPLRADANPFGRGGPKGAVWVRPELLAEVEFTEWTREGLLRHPSFKGLREDKDADEVVAEVPAGDDDGIGSVRELPGDAREVTVDGRPIRVSNWSKVLWPQAGFTKGDLVDFYRQIAPTLLPHLEGRPLTLKRYPNGVDAQHFYEKQSPKHRPDWVQTARVPTGSKVIEYTLVADTATLVWLANLADIELHTSLARAADPQCPTMLVFDLDPGAPADIVQCCEVALVLRGLFDGLGLVSLAKTSGSKGMQVYVPLNRPDATYDQTKPFAKAIAELLEQRMPDLVVSRQTKTLRPGKVLVDWSQNDEHKTTVNAYSVRARERPTVSTPIAWDEVAACHDAGDAALLTFDTEAVLARVDELGDLFAPALSEVQELPGL
jgi:bifunctional non-homologous end joining protein LigD